MRERIADQYNQSAGRLVGGENKYGGARFAKDIAGTPLAEPNLIGVTGRTPRGFLERGGPSTWDLWNLVEVSRQRVCVSCREVQRNSIVRSTKTWQRRRSAQRLPQRQSLAAFQLWPAFVNGCSAFGSVAAPAETPMTDAMLWQFIQAPTQLNAAQSSTTSSQ